MYFRNVDRINLREIFELVGLFFLNGAIIFFLALFYYRNSSKAGMLTNIVMLFILFFSLIEKLLITIFPMLYYWHIVMIILTALIILASVIKTKGTIEIALKINNLFLTMFTGLIALNGLFAAPVIFQKLSEEPNQSKLQIQRETLETNSNVYYFIFDEYGGLENLERFCGFDNTPFYDSLEEFGFNVSKDSRNNTISTDIEIPNLLNLEMINNDNMSHENRMKALENPNLFRLFKENGYQLNIVSDMGFIPVEMSEIDYDYTFETEIYENDTIKALIIKNTIYYPFIIRNPNDRIIEIENMFQYIHNSWKIQPNNQFTFAYFTFPHLPWVVDEFGRRISEAEWENWQNSNIYLGQLKYTSKKILETVDQIIKANPDAIIIIQSDHGFRQQSHLRLLYEKEIEDMELEMKYQRNILNAVYYKGERINIESLSGINTLILVINNHFGLNYELLEQAD